MLLVAACGREPAGPRPAPIEIVAAGGDGQYGTAGERLPRPLRVIVREIASGRPVPDLDVRWRVESGDAVVVSGDREPTDDAGVSEVVLELGVAEGEVLIAAETSARGSAEVMLRAFLVGTPRLDSLGAGQVETGGSLVVFGANFSPVPEQNVVRFGGIRAPVIEASASRLEVLAPSCLPERASVGVEVALGAVGSATLPVQVVSGAPPPPLAVGDYRDLADPGGFDCVRLPGAGGARYLAVAHARGTVSAGIFPFTMSGLAEGTPSTVQTRAGPVTGVTGQAVAATEGEGWTDSAQARFERALRREEARLVEERRRDVETGGAAGAPLRAPARVPEAGSKRTFFVFNGSSSGQEFDEVVATARYVGREVVIYVDDQTPAPGFSDDEIRGFAERFDEVIHPTVTGEFGLPSDLDENDRVVALFTPVVNQLTVRESASFVGGFFFGRDLLPELESSNAAEVFYALVPDPDGQFSDPRPTSGVLEAVPAIFAHEFQHMVHFNQRVLRLDAPTQDALWMLEGLAQMAEELVARSYDERGAPEDAELFRTGNQQRSRIYLARPDTVSLIVAHGGGTLPERGAGFLFLLYAERHEGGDVLRRLTQTVRTGVANIEAETGTPWERIYPDWATASAAAFFPDMPVRFTYPGLDFPRFLGHPPPLTVETGGTRDFRHAAELRSGANKYFVLEPPEDGSLAVGFGGLAGGPKEEVAGLVLRLVRIR